MDCTIPGVGLRILYNVQLQVEEVDWGVDGGDESQQQQATHLVIGPWGGSGGS